MCGLTGIYAHDASIEVRAAVRVMADSLAHRGPDDWGDWFDLPLGLAHRRLSILDLSPLGHQPMVSNRGRFVIVFNGEIYNFSDLKAELLSKGHYFRGGSDTEVVLAAFEEWGIEQSLKRFIGMFAIAVWDREERILSLARDRLGEKPLYYGWIKGAFVFASELKAFLALPFFQRDVSRDSLLQYVRFNYVPAPLSIFKGIFKLVPGSHLSIPEAALRERVDFSPYPESCACLRPRRYWSSSEASLRPRVNLSDEDALDTLESLLSDAVRRQMIADVPHGAFLSGGIDSSTIVALMQRASSIPVKTFSIGFYEKDYNEADFAKTMASQLKTDHTELYLTPEQTYSIIPSLPSIYDEPFGDSSQIPTFLVSRLARTQVTVSLSGDGGDELFCGYLRYPWGRKLWGSIRYLPVPLRRGLSAAIQGVSPGKWDALFRNMLPGVHVAGHKMHRIASILHAASLPELYKGMVTLWTDDLVLGANDVQTAFDFAPPNQDDPLRFMSGLDQVTYLPDDILVKVDRAAMAVSLETRAPFLDHRIVEFAWTLPDRMKVRDGQTKWLLRKLLNRFAPRKMFERPKMGFAVPVDHWIRGPLRDWCETLLAPDRLRLQGYLKADMVTRCWQEHLSGKKNWSYQLWIVLMLEAWLDAWNKAPGSVRAAETANCSR